MEDRAVNEAGKCLYEMEEIFDEGDGEDMLRC